MSNIISRSKSWFIGLGTVVGVIGSLLSLFAFFSVKPIPIVQLITTQQISISERASFADNCAMPSDRSSLQKLVNLDGQLVFVNFKFSQDFTKADSTGNEIGDEASCYFERNNLESGELFGWGNINPKEFFELPISTLITEETNGIENQEEAFTVAPILLLPISSQEFLRVDVCEGHCYNLSGAARVHISWASEGFIGISIVPVNVYENSYLTSRYECRLKALETEYEIFAPIYCALF